VNGVQIFFWEKLENSINRLIDLDPYAKGNLKNLANKILAIELTDIKLKIFLFPTLEKIRINNQYEGEVHAVLQGSSFAVLNMGVRPNAEDSLFSGDVVIEGDLELGQEFRTFIGAIDIDWEEQLSLVTGDVIAHKLTNVLRQVSSWGKQTINTLGLDTVEYFQYESQMLPGKNELNQYLSDVDLIRGDVDRLEARIARLRQKASN